MAKVKDFIKMKHEEILFQTRLPKDLVEAVRDKAKLEKIKLKGLVIALFCLYLNEEVKNDKEKVRR